MPAPGRQKPAPPMLDRDAGDGGGCDYDHDGACDDARSPSSIDNSTSSVPHNATPAKGGKGSLGVKRY